MAINMVGNKYGHLLVEEMLYNHQNKNKTFCKCKCDCGNEVIRNAFALRNNYSEFTSCGCKRAEAVRKYCARDIDGQKFGRLTVLETIWGDGKPKVKCQCDCGTIGIFNKNDIQTGHTKSCGCLNREIISENSTKDWTGFVSESGVKAIAPYMQNEKKQWLWIYECPLCHNEFIALPAKIASNHTTSCGCAKQSFGERVIKNYLSNKGIKYSPQYSFNNCRSKQVLLFDFAIFSDNQLLGLIEFDGQQHFYPVEWFGGQRGFEATVKRDRIKNDYCKDNNIPLLRVNYTQSVDEIEEELDKYIESVTTTGGVWQQAS